MNSAPSAVFLLVRNNGMDEEVQVSTRQIKTVQLPNDIRLQYVEQGDESGVPVLLLHGVTDSWYSFDLMLPHLPNSIRAFAISQRGHGDSSRPESGYRFRDFAQDLDGYIQTLHLDKAIVVGHSMSSAVARRFAIDYPERVKGLVLVGSFATLRGNQGVKELWDSGISHLSDPVDPGFVREFQESTISQPVPEDFLNKVVEESLKLPARVWKELFEGFLQDDFTAELTRIKAPTLLVWGAHDLFCSRRDQEILLGAIAGSRLVEYRDSGHAPHWEEPRRFASDLLEFVEGRGAENRD